MITLAVIEFIIDAVNSFIMNHLSNLIQPLTDLTTWISAFQVPQTLLDIYSVVCYFLPVTTIGILLGFTFLIVIAKGVISLVHFIFLGLPFSS